MARRPGRLARMRHPLPPSTRARALVALLAVAAGCAPERGTLRGGEGAQHATGDTVVDGPTEDDPEDDDCEAPIIARTPRDGQRDVPVTVIPSVALGGPDVTARIRLRRDGRDVPGQTDLSEDGRTVRLEPIAPVVAGAEHEMIVQWTCGTATTRFTTAASTWRLESGTAARPEGVRGDVAEALGPVLVLLAAAEDGDLRWRFGVPDGPRPDPCVPTADALGTRSEAGEVAASAPLVPWSIDGRVRTVYGLDLEARLEGGDDRLDDVTLRLLVDTRDAVEEGDLCGALEGEGRACVACPRGGTRTCVEVPLVDVEATPVSFAVPERTPADIADDPACED